MAGIRKPDPKDEAFALRLANALEPIIDSYSGPSALQSFLEKKYGAPINHSKISKMAAGVCQPLSVSDLRLLDQLLRYHGHAGGIGGLIRQRPIDALALTNPNILFVLGAKHTSAGPEVDKWLQRTTYMSMSDVQAYNRLRLGIDRANRGGMDVKLQAASYHRSREGALWTDPTSGERSIVCIGSPISNPACDLVLRSMFPSTSPIRFGWTADKAASLSSQFTMTEFEQHSAPLESPWGTLGVFVGKKPFWIRRSEGLSSAGDMVPIHSEYGIIAAQRSGGAVLLVVAGTIGPATVEAARAFARGFDTEIPEAGHGAIRRGLALVVETQIYEEQAEGENRVVYGKPEIIHECVLEG